MKYVLSDQNLKF